MYRTTINSEDYPVQFVPCTYDDHAEAILAMLNEAILTSTALYDYRPRTLDNMHHWFTAKQNGNFPIIGALDDSGFLLGFASYGTFRAWPAYKYSVEHSVYVHSGHRGQGIGYALMQQLIATAIEQQYHALIGGIDIDNGGSIALHKKLGFVHVGTIQQAGFKFNRWLDLAFYQLLLETPANPVDG